MKKFMLKNPPKNSKDNIDLLNRVIFGDEETGDVGMKQKIDDVHDILIKARSVGGFFGGLGGTLKWLLIVAAVIVVLKTWFAGFVSVIASKM